MAAGGDTSGLPAEKKKWVHVETFEEHNIRLNLPEKDRLKKRDWAEVQNRFQAQYDATREAALKAGETPPPEQDIRKPIPKWIDDRLKAIS
jgi:hypothetical protein